jgi:hypothetical protein
MEAFTMYRASCLIVALSATLAFGQSTKPTKAATVPTSTTFTVEEPAGLTQAEKEQVARGFFGFAAGTLICMSLAAFLFELIPWFIAVMRGHNNKTPIFLVCFFLGWTIIGWIIALVWAFSDNTRKTRYR